MTTPTSSPNAGDLIYFNFSPQAGHEQAGSRPALVISDAKYNARAGLALVCPITRQQKGYPFEVPLPPTAPVQGVILADQIRSIDYVSRKYQTRGSVSDDILEEVRARIAPLLGL